ncbi:MAG: zinc ribbon domain-containing protein [Acidiferrobacterales bacterium]
MSTAKTSPIPEKPECPFCKTDLRPGATVCPSCGARYIVNPHAGYALGGVAGATVLFIALVFYGMGLHVLGVIVGLIGAPLFWMFSKTEGRGRAEWIRRV